MEKIVLSKGAEFELITNAIQTSGNNLTVTFLPGDYTAEQLMDIWSDNATMIIKANDGSSLRKLVGFTNCDQVTITRNYLLRIDYHCPECNALVAFDAKNCPECNAAFDAPMSDPIKVTICTVKCTIPDINKRMDDVEESVEDIINTILG